MFQVKVSDECGISSNGWLVILGLSAKCCCKMIGCLKWIMVVMGLSGLGKKCCCSGCIRNDDVFKSIIFSSFFTRESSYSYSSSFWLIFFIKRKLNLVCMSMMWMPP